VKIFECVPNVSEGRDTATLDACARAIEGAGVTLAHRTNDASHHRSVFTYFGTYEPVLAATLALARVACERVDLRVHRGAHPRIGAVDVVPFVPFADACDDDAIALARAAATSIWSELRVPSFFYGAAGSAGHTLADIRRGEFEGLGTRAHAFDTGDAPHASAGAIAIGVRATLVAFNVVLASRDVALARAIARNLRERDGGLRTLRALGLALDDGRVQVSCNVTDFAATPLWLVRSLVRTLARRAGADIAETEVIGLVPRAALEDVARQALGIDALPRATA
jgi:glutamate formiminotransferase